MDEARQRELPRSIDDDSDSNVLNSGHWDLSNACENSGFVCFGVKVPRMPSPLKEARRGNLRFANAMQIYNAARERSQPVRLSSRVGSHTLQAPKRHKKRAVRRFGFLNRKSRRFGG